MPKGGTVDGVVGFAKVDETGVCWGVELSDDTVCMSMQFVHCCFSLGNLGGANCFPR